MQYHYINDESIDSEANFYPNFSMPVLALAVSHSFADVLMVFVLSRLLTDHQ